MKNTSGLFVTIVLFILAIVPAACSHASGKPSGPDITKAFNDISVCRNQAESWIKSANSRFKEYEKKDEALKAIEDAYSAAAARGNAFIETVQLNLTAKSLSKTQLEPYVSDVKTSIDKLKTTIDDEEKKMRNFLANSTDTKSFIGGLITSDIVEGAVVGLTKAGITIWQAAQKAKKEEIEDIKKELGKRRWQDWGQINPE